MGYRLHRGRHVADEVPRIVEQQLEMAIAGLDSCLDSIGSDGLHASRRHIKKVRALIRLVRPALGRRYRDMNDRLRAIQRLLAPEADAQAAVLTFQRLVEQYPRVLSPATLDTLRTHLIQHLNRTGEQIRSSHTLEAAAALLRAECEGSSHWPLKDHGFHTIAGGLESAALKGRRAMARATRRPTHRRYHTWRQRVKDQWLHVRLLQARCNDALALDETRLEELDGCLGEYHDCTILRDALSADASLARPDVDPCLELVRRHEETLRTRAETIAAQVYHETPRHFVKRVRRLWRAGKRVSGDAQRGVSWRPAA